MRRRRDGGDHAPDRASGNPTSCFCSRPTIRTGSSTATRCCHPGFPRRCSSKSCATIRSATYPRLAKAPQRHGGKRMSTLELDRSTARGREAAGHRLRHPSGDEGLDRGASLSRQSAGSSISTVYGSHLRHAFSEALAYPRMSPDARPRRCLSGRGRPARLEPGADAQASISIPTASNFGMLIPLRWNPRQPAQSRFRRGADPGDEHLAGRALGQATSRGCGPRS